jgi:[ribosomal protein S5]-alanine N-acetyltransferase
LQHKNRLLLNLLPISLDDKLNAEFEAHPDCRETLQMSIDFYKRAGYDPPWIGYFVKLEGEIVGSAGFKGKPKNNKVEIAYGTFSKHEGKGIGTEMCRQLVLLALKTNPDIKITARTLPEENVSASILKKNGFVLLGTVWDDEDGNVWEWEYNRHQLTQRACRSEIA